ncbi:unnamed protein product, partial [Prorocentrum cordatum]
AEGAAEGAAAARPPAARRLQLPEEALVEGGTDAWQYMHAQYRFDLFRQSMRRDGKGEAWLSFESGLPFITLKGSAQSPRFGNGSIAISLDTEKQVMYTRTTLENLHEAECVKYLFPKPSDNEARMKVLRARRKQVSDWERQWEEGGQTTGATIQWTKSYELDFVMDGDQVQAFSLSRAAGGNGERVVVKQVRLETAETAATVPDDARGNFADPHGTCRLEEKVKHPLAHVELVAPHQKSSALNDLLLVLAAVAEQGHPVCRSGCGEEDWSALFVTLSMITVPGDISVMIEEPSLEVLEALGSLSFDYTATVFNQGEQRTSDGSVRLNFTGPHGRAFRMRGEANHTKVGPLTLDVIARGPSGHIYANVDLSLQHAHQCVQYDYPVLTESSQEMLQDLATRPLNFFTIAELDGEDCGIFVAQLARGDWIHLWVDMEAERPHSVLRSEVHREGSLLRRTEVLRWHTDDVEFTTVPPKEWACTENPEASSGETQLAHLGLRQVHKKSIQLQDTLYALRNLSRGFAILEVLGLPGDVAIMVEEPTVSDSAEWRRVAFEYSAALSQHSGGDPSTEVPATYSFDGSFAADVEAGKFWINLHSPDLDPSAPNVSVLVEPGMLSVHMQDATDSRCLRFQVPNENLASPWSAPIFASVEDLGQMACNRFLIRSVTGGTDVDFWYSKESRSVCQMGVLSTQSGQADIGAVFTVTKWHRSEPSERLPASRWEVPKDWNCQDAGQSGSDWALITPQQDVPREGAPADRRGPVEALLPAGSAISTLALACGAVGALPTAAAAALSRLAIRPPQGGTAGRPEPAAPPKGVFDQDLAHFSFSFATSTSGVEGASSEGRVFVDLARRRLLVLGHASMPSAGMDKVVSFFDYQGDNGWAYTMNQGKGFDICFSLRVTRSAFKLDNPFALRFSEGGCVEHGTPKGARRCTTSLGSAKADPTDKVVDILISDSQALMGVTFKNLGKGITSQLTITGWSTEPADERITAAPPRPL